MKRIYKNKKEAMFGGVCAGVAKYFSVDPNILRISTVLLFVATGFFPVGLAYFLAWWMLPEEPPYNVVSEQ